MDDKDRLIERLRKAISDADALILAGNYMEAHDILQSALRFALLSNTTG